MSLSNVMCTLFCTKNNTIVTDFSYSLLYVTLGQNNRFLPVNPVLYLSAYVKLAEILTQ